MNDLCNQELIYIILKELNIPEEQRNITENILKAGNLEAQSNYSLLPNCNRAVTIRTMLDIPPMLVHQDRVFAFFPIMVTIWMVVFQKYPWWLLLGLVFRIVDTYFQYKSLQVIIIRTLFFGKPQSGYYLDGVFLLFHHGY